MKHDDFALKVYGILGTVVFSIAFGVIALNWWIIGEVQGNARPALAGAFLAFEAFVVFEILGFGRKGLDAVIARWQFRDNAVENENIARSARASAELAILNAKQRTEGARGDNLELRNQIAELKALVELQKATARITPEPAEAPFFDTQFYYDVEDDDSIPGQYSRGGER